MKYLQQPREEAMNFLQQPTEQEFIDYVNATPKKIKHSYVSIDLDCNTDITAREFIALCQRSLDEVPAELRDEASARIDDDTIEFRAQREETDDEHIARCREEFDAARCAKHNRFLQYQLLKREFGDA